MLALLKDAAQDGKPYAPYVAGEILAFIKRALHSKKEVAEITKQVHDHLRVMVCSAVT